jgi:hypothetical protein
MLDAEVAGFEYEYELPDEQNYSEYTRYTLAGPSKRGQRGFQGSVKSIGSPNALSSDIEAIRGI